MSTESYLATFGVTMAQASAFVSSHTGSVAEIAQVVQIARQFGVTNEMLGEIAGGYSGAVVKGYLAARGINTADLDASPVVPLDLGPLQSVVALDTSTGILSLAALRAQALTLTDPLAYQRVFDPVQYAGAQDGFFSPAETGLPALGNLPATSETLESLFYGSIIRFAATIDDSEVQPLTEFVTSHQAGLDQGDPAVHTQLVALLAAVAATPAAQPFFTDALVAQVAMLSVIELVGVSTSNDALFDEILSGFRTVF